MKWQSVYDFVFMNGQGWYVWPSYLLVAVCIVAEIFFIKWRDKNAEIKFKQYVNLKRVQDNESEA